MAYKPISDLSTDVTISLGGVSKKTGKKNATKLEGYYLGSRQIEDKKKKDGVSYIHVFQTAQGNVGVWGKTDMDRKLKNAQIGQMTLITFDKMVPTANGEMYKFSVAQDDENVIEVGAYVATPTSSTTPTYQGYDEEESSLDEEEPALDEAPLTRKVASQPLSPDSAKARVQALLNGGKRN